MLSSLTGSTFSHYKGRQKSKIILDSVTSKLHRYPVEVFRQPLTVQKLLNIFDLA
jgi:hypothetical protein